MNNKKVKDIIDELVIGFEQEIDGIVYKLSEIDGDFFTFDSKANKNDFKVLDSGALFDIIYAENE